jgi:O-antigen ligase
MIWPGILLAYMAWTAASYGWSCWPYATLRHAVRELPILALGLAAMLTCRSSERWVALARVFVVAALIQAACVSGIAICTAVARDWTLRQAFYRFPVFYPNKNFGCSIYIAGAAMALGLFLRRRALQSPEEDGSESRGRGELLRLSALLAALGLFIFVLLIADSLAGYLAAAVCAAGYLWCYLPRRVRRAVAVCVPAVGTAALLLIISVSNLRNPLLERAMAPRSTVGLRLLYWGAGANAFAARPIAGWGAGTYPAVYPRTKLPLASKMRVAADFRPEHPHGEPVRVAVDLGLIGLGLYVLLMVLTFTESYRVLQRQGRDVRVLGFAIWAGSLAFFTQSVVGKAPMSWTFAASASSSWWQRDGDTTPVDPARVVTPGRLLAFGLTVVLVSWFWWSWGVGGYRSMVAFRHVEAAHNAMRTYPQQDSRFIGMLRRNLEEARPRCLWPPSVLYMDLVVGTYMARKGEYADAATYLEQHVHRWAPDMLKTPLVLARCYLRTGRTEAATEMAVRYVRKNPYKLDGYGAGALAAISPALAASMLEEHVIVRNDMADREKVLLLFELYAFTGEGGRARALAMAMQQTGLDAGRRVREAAAELRERGDNESANLLRHVLPEFFPGPQ